jgi:hypothetical protein
VSTLPTIGRFCHPRVAYALALESPLFPLAGAFGVDVLDDFSPEAGVLGADVSLAPDFEAPSELAPELVESPDPSPEEVDASPDGDLVELFVRLSVL